MSVVATKTPIEALSAEVKNMNSRLEKYHTEQEEFMKAVNVPASKASLAPQDFMAKATHGGSLPFVIGSDGAVMPVNPAMLRSSSGQPPRGIGMGLALKALVDLRSDQTTGDQKTKAANLLAEYDKEAEAKGFNPTLLKTALAESSGVTGGYTVPPQFISNLMKLSEEDSIFSPRSYHHPMPTLTADIPYLDQTTAFGAGITPFLGGIQAFYAAEAATITESEPKFRSFQLKANQLSFYAVASNTLLADNAVGLDALLTMLFKQAIAWYADFNYFQGNGVGKPLGVLNAPCALAVTRTNAAHVVYRDAVNMWAHFHREGWRASSTAWVCHPSVIPELLQMNDLSGSASGVGTGRFVFQPIDQGATVYPPDSGNGGYCCGYLLGQPVLVTEKLPALGTSYCFMLADFSKFVIGDRQDTTIDISPHVYFLNNQLVWRVIMRHDGQPWLSNVVTLADGVWTVSPFVILSQ